jgi:hypothetical protein
MLVVIVLKLFVCVFGDIDELCDVDIPEPEIVGAVVLFTGGIRFPGMGTGPVALSASTDGLDVMGTARIENSKLHKMKLEDRFIYSIV